MLQHYMFVYTCITNMHVALRTSKNFSPLGALINRKLMQLVKTGYTKHVFPEVFFSRLGLAKRNCQVLAILLQLLN